jgi:lysophospholipase L1-like esterase
MENALIPALYPEGDLEDMAHPTKTGYEKMADVWYEALDELLSADIFPEDTSS